MEAQFGKPTEGGNELEEQRDIQSRFNEEPLLEVRLMDLAEPETTTTSPFITTERVVDTEQAETTSTPSPISASCSEIGAKV